ncbi:MAG: helix-turn-helix domain-containing protein [Oscillospiraceae bacterium]|jgi:hypothetical protein|nr:helix-turn-helix domain-containing protein [Oscillospiraceae bacterium]
MKLSMWMLFDELAQYGARSAIRDGNPVIEDVRVFIAGDVWEDSCVCLGRSDDFFGDGGDSVILINGRDTITFENARLPETLNRVIGIFGKYRRWDDALRSAVHSADPFQNILDVAHDVFRCPMFFGHKNLRIYAITRQYSEEQVYVGWDEVKAINTMPPSLFGHLKPIDMALFPDDADPIAIPALDDDSKFFDYQIRANCYLRGNIWGHLYIYYSRAEVSPALLQLARHAADIYGELLDSSQSGTDKYTQYSFLTDLLDGRETAVGAMTGIYWALGWPETEELVLCKIATPPVTYDGVFFDWLCESLSAQAAGSIVFPYSKSVVLILRQSDTDLDELISGFAQSMERGNYHCGISFPFVGLENILPHFFQAGYSIESATSPELRTHYFKDCAFDGLAAALKSHLEWRDWVLPSIFKLINSDEAHGTEYYKTLYCLLISNGHLGNTAKRLYIHRNTLMYRLEKIAQILEADIFNESVSAFLRFCYALMRDEYPVVIPDEQGEYAL